MKFNKLTKNQYLIIRALNENVEWAYHYSYLESETKLPLAVLKAEVKILREAGYTTHERGLFDDTEMRVAGSGISLNEKSNYWELIEKYEKENDQI